MEAFVLLKCPGGLVLPITLAQSRGELSLECGVLCGEDSDDWDQTGDYRRLDLGLAGQ